MKDNLRVFLGILTVLGVAVSAIFVGLTYSTQLVMAQINNATTATAIDTVNITKKQHQQVNITGSIPLQSTISQALRSEIQVPMADALTTAQNSVGGNSSVVAAFLSPLKGFLVYTIGVMSTNNTHYKVIVDPGNGEILYTSQGRQMDSLQQLMSGPFGHGKEFGPEKGIGERGFGHGGGGGQGGGFWQSR